MKMSQKITWINSWKGIGIIAVVVGHIVPPVARYLYWFHMPLFFFISGYLYKTKFEYFSFFKKKSLHLLVPYISFTVLLIIFRYLYSHFQILQGNETVSNTGWFTVFWFVICLFLTQQLYNLLSAKIGDNHWLMIATVTGSYALAMIYYWFFKDDFTFPQSLNAVAIALPFYWLGHMTARHSIDNAEILKLALIIFVSAFVVDHWKLVTLSFDMKHTRYGFPIINVLLSVAGITITQYFAKILDEKNNFGNAIVCELGDASMVIMYLHQPIQLILKQYPILANEFIRIIVALFAPYIIYKIISHSRKNFFWEIFQILEFGSYRTAN
jgi:fucose 4-O-acetylase-like acetyltransferase